MGAPLPYDPKWVRERLQDRAGELAERLGFHERPDRQGRIFPLNPMRSDRHPGSFVIWLRGDAAGAWKDYAAPEWHGDVFDLIREVAKLASWTDSYWWALDFLGLERRAVRTISQAEDDARRARRDRAVAAAKELTRDTDKSRELFKRWLGLQPIERTIAETYLREAREIPLERLAHPPGALRFDPELMHVEPDTGEITSWPAMVAAMTRGSKIAGLHRTWLARDGSGKAPVKTPKMMLGPIRGSAIRLTSGPSGLSPKAAYRAGVSDRLAIGEGIETALSIAVSWPEFRVWAAGSLSLMGLLDWPPCVRNVTLLRDNDWHSGAARRAFEAVEAHWRAMADRRDREAGGEIRSEVFVVNSPIGSDFNDMIRGAA